MKNDRKSTTPIIAAPSEKNKNRKPTPPANGNGAGTKARVSRVSGRATDRMKSIVLERIGDGIIGFDADMIATYVNGRAGELLGRKPADLVGRNLWQEYTETIGTSFADACQRAFETQTVVPFEGHFPLSDKWLQGRAYPSADGLSVLFTNGARQGQEEMEKSEYHTFNISRFPEQNPNPVTCFTLEGKLLYANPAAASLLAFWKQQASGTIPGYLHTLLKSTLESGSNEKLEIEQEGKIFSCLLVPFRESGYVNIYFRDITERKQAEEALNAIINQSTGGITRTDLNGTFTFVNQTFCEMLGYSESELIGKTIWQVSHEEDIPKNKRLFERMLTEGEPYQLEKRIIRRNGSALWVSVGTAPLRDAAGQIRGATSIIVDITRRKRAEESLLDSARRTLYFASLSDAIRPLSDPAQIQIEAARILGAHLKASRVAYVEMESRDAGFVRYNYVDGVADILGGFHINEYVPADLLPKFHRGSAVIVSDVQIDRRFSESQKAAHEAISIRAQIIVPFIKSGELIAALCIQQSQPRLWKNEDVTTAEETAERMHAAIERGHAETRLRESEERLRLASQAAKMCTWELDIQKQTYKLGDNFAEVVGFSADLLPSNSNEVSDMLNVAEDMPAVREAVINAVKTRNDVPPLQYRVLNPVTKEIIWLEVNARLAYDPVGNPQRMFGLVQNITERKRAEENLRASEEKYRRIVETANEGIWEIDGDTRTVFVNPRMAEMLGYTVEEMMGRSAFEFLLPEDHPEGEQRLERAKRGTAARASEFRYRRKDGSVLWTVASNTPKLDEQGNLLGAFAMMSDITERKQAEEALRQSEERFAQFMNHLPGLAWIKDIEGRYVYANAAAEKAFSTPREKLYGKTDQDIFPAEVAAQFKQNDERALLAGKGVQVIEELEHEDGVLHYSLVSKFPIPGPDGKTTLIGGTAFDITERIQMEEALTQARQQAEETADRIARLQEITAALARFTTPAQLAELVLEQGGRATGAAAGILVELINDGKELKTIAALGYPAAAVRTEPVPLSAPTPMSDCIRTGQAVWLRSHEEFAAQYPQLAEVRRAFGNEATVALPLIVGDRVLGGLAFSFVEQREFLLEERGFFLAAAQQCSQGLERARAEEALHDSEARYRAIISQATAGIVRKDSNGKLLFVNQAFCEMLGYSDSELMDKTMWQLTHEEDIKENKRLYNRLMVEGTPFQLEKRLIRRDGSILWATVSVSPVLDSTGKPQSAVSVYADITERKRAEQELHYLNLELEERVQKRTAELQSAYEFLRESEATSRLILESMPDAIVITNADGLIVHCNAQVESLFGYSPNEVLGQPVETLLPERFHEQHVKHRGIYENQRYRRIMGLGMELFGQRKDGSEFPVDVMLSPISDNTTWDVMVTIRDNTEQKQAQEALRSSEEKLRTLFEILPVGISFLDKEARITEMNSALAEILGAPKSHLLKGSFKSRRYVRPDGTPMPPTEFASTRALTENKTIHNVETGIIRESDEIIWTNVSASPVRVAEVQAVVVTVDITKRKQAEEALYKNRERLRALSRRLVEVQEEERRALARELHDRVGQNLAALNLNLNILRSQISEEFLQQIGSRLNDSVELVKQILTITRNVMDDLRSNVLDDYGLEAALNEYTEKFTQRTGIPVVSDIPANPIPRLNPSIEMTLLRIAQEALTNVARHAQATQVNLRLGMDKDSIHLTIQDNGSGILSWQKANQPGSHGLRIIRERAEAFGGSLELNSAYKKGTQIEVKIPLGSGSQNKVS